LIWEFHLATRRLQTAASAPQVKEADRTILATTEECVAVTRHGLHVVGGAVVTLEDAPLTLVFAGHV
jgi:hypothetical protein